MEETWNHQLIEEIRNQKEQERSDDRDNLLRLTSHKLYGGKAHFALELIQNAEDEGSKSVIFIIDEGYVAVINDGRPFDEEDVWGICSVKPGRKKNKIGFFGLGFKSVFNVSEKPQIISGNFNFSIENFIYPIPEKSIPDKLKSCYQKENGAIFILQVAPGQFESLRIDLNRIDSKILLFLENINQLIFIDKIKGDRWEIIKESDGEMIKLFDSRTEEKTEWKVFHKTIKVVDENIVPEDKKGIKETRITVALPTFKEKIEELRKTGVIYCYLPTRQRTDLGFLIQADFVPTIGRESISEEPWNEWLMKELGVFSADIFEGEHKGRRIKLLDELGVGKIDEGTIISFLENSKSLDKKPKEWFLNLYDYLASVFDVNTKRYWDEKRRELYDRLLKTNFIITSEEKTVPKEDPKKPDMMICYPQRLNLKEINKLFPKGEIVFIHPYFQESTIYRRKNVDQSLEEKIKK